MKIGILYSEDNINNGIPANQHDHSSFVQATFTDRLYQISFSHTDYPSN